MGKKKHRIIKVILIVVLVPLFLAIVSYVSSKLTSNPLNTTLYLTEGLLFTHMILTIYDRYFEGAPQLDKRVAEAEEQLEKIKYEVDEIKLVLIEQGYKDPGEITVSASVQRDINETKEEESHEEE